MSDPDSMRLALVAPPTSTVSPASLGGFDHVRRLAEGLAERGHHVTLIGADLNELAAGQHTIVDTDPTAGQRATPELIDRLHAEQVGRIIDQLQVQAVSDHTRTGYLPASEHVQVMGQTLYQPIASSLLPPPARTPLAHLCGGYVAIAHHQQRNGLGLPWLDVIHPGIAFDEHPLRLEHDGPCLYMGPLRIGDGARAALDAAHQSDRPIVLAGTQPDGEARAYAEVKLRPHLGAADRLLEQVGMSERRELLASACCLVAPLRYDAPYSLEIVEAMAYGTPVVTMTATVGAELVSHGVSGLVLNHRGLLPGAIDRADRLDPKEIREDAAERLDLAMTVAAYEALFVRLLGGRS